jgi:hypothetical protein
MPNKNKKSTKINRQRKSRKPDIEKLDITNFIRCPLLLNDQCLSVAQSSFLKVTYGLALDEEEMDIFRRATGRQEYVPTQQREATLQAGRRSGKTSKIACRIAIYEAWRIPRSRRPERRRVMFIAPTLDQAKIAFHFILQDLRSSEILAQNIAKVSANEIELRNHVVICCCPCSPVKVRGWSAIAVICDEVAFWDHKVTSVNCDEEVLAAVRPTMATYPTGKLIKISSPNRKSGIMWDEYQRRGELPFYFWQLSSAELNPRLSKEYLEAERLRDPTIFRREYLAEFVDSAVSWIEPELLLPCIIRGRKEVPRAENVTYAAAIDPGFKGSEFALAITHLTSEGVIVVDRLESWTGSKDAPLGFERVCREIAGILAIYKINALVGDQLSAPIIEQEFLKYGTVYRERTFNRQTRVMIFSNLKYLLIQRRIELVDDSKLVSQLLSLEYVLGNDGNADIRASSGVKDDVAIAVGLSVLILSESAFSPEPPPMSFCRVDRSWEDRLYDAGRAWHGFQIRELDCPKYPKCSDEGRCECRGF